MKSILTTIFLFLFANSAFAIAFLSSDLCDTSCNLTISFPSGGSITAVEPLTFTFGDGGLVDTVATNTAYVQGNLLTLGVGEVLTFGAGGSLDLGTGGNLNYSNITVTTDGIVEVLAIGGTQTITLSSTTINGGATFNVSGLIINIEGAVTVDIGLTLNIVGTDLNATTGCGTTVTSSTLTLSGSTTPIVIDTSNDCNTISTSTGVSLPTVYVILVANDANNTTGTFTITPTDTTIGTIAISPADAQTSDSGSVGVLFVTLMSFVLFVIRIGRKDFSIR